MGRERSMACECVACAPFTTKTIDRQAHTSAVSDAPPFAKPSLGDRLIRIPASIR
jgi:CO dehydrogenase/acetyl-CoA synthase gamma subunit (corrinoid Fe-S protein)